MTKSTNNFRARETSQHRGPTPEQEAQIQRLSNPKSTQDFIDALATPGTPAFQKMMNLIAANVQANNVINQLVDMYVMQQVRLNQEEKEAVYKGMVAKENAEKEKVKDNRLSEILSQQHRKEIAKMLEPDIIMKMFEEKSKQERVLAEDVKKLSAVYEKLEEKHTEIVNQWQEIAKKDKATFLNAMKENKVEFSFVNDKGETIKIGADDPVLDKAADAAAEAARLDDKKLRVWSGSYKSGAGDAPDKPAAVPAEVMDVDTIKANLVKLNSSLSSLMMAIKGPSPTAAVSKEQDEALKVLQAARDKLQQNVNAIATSSGDVNKAQMIADMKNAVDDVNKAMANYKAAMNAAGKEEPPQVATGMRRFNNIAMEIFEGAKPASAKKDERRELPPPEHMAKNLKIVQLLHFAENITPDGDNNPLINKLKNNKPGFNLYERSLSDIKIEVQDHLKNFQERKKAMLELETKTTQHDNVKESVQSLIKQYHEVTGKTLNAPNQEKVEKAQPTPFSTRPRPS